MKKNLCWLVGGLFLAAGLGAAKVATFDTIQCTTLSCAEMIAVGPEGAGASLVGSKEQTVLHLESSNGQVVLMLIVDNDKALMVCKTPKGKKTTVLSP